MRIRAVAALACGTAFIAIGCSDQASITDSLQMKKGPPVTEVSNSLSVPTIMVGGGGFTGVTCGVDAQNPSPLLSPTGTPLSGYEIDPTAYYYVQRISAWQAQCYGATAASAEADWGDNLAGDAKLKVGKPIRVELGLLTTDLSMQGFTVVKLEPSELDRVSAYGTLATSDGLGGYYATAEYLAARVHDGQVTFSVQKVGETDYVIEPGSNPTAEINATGKVVYGYNMRVTEKGDYVITFVTPNVTLTGSQDGGLLGTTAEGYSTVSLTITVQ